MFETEPPAEPQRVSQHVPRSTERNSSLPDTHPLQQRLAEAITPNGRARGGPWPRPSTGEGHGPGCRNPVGPEIFTLRNGKITQFFELYDTAVAERAYQQTSTA